MNAIVPVVEMKKEKLVVSSRKIANQLKKEHSKIIRTLDKLVLEKPDLASLIIPTFYRVNNQKRQYKEYLLTKDGFTLYMFNIQGYNDFKMAYINEFNRMERALNEKPKQQMLDLNNRLYFGLFTVLTIKGLSELSGIDEADIRYAISKLNLRPMLLREDSLEEFKERNRIPFKHVSQLTVLGFNESKQILKLFKKDHLINLLKEYFNDNNNNKVKVIETTQDKDVNVKMLGKCIELYDELINMDIKKIYELKTDLFTNKNYPQHIKKLIFRVFNTVELKKLNI